ncbi:Regulatory protein RecX [Thalassocella blandensis]|nr:Regulatory protein RecX [Thalassocella blandensis]
MYSFDATNEITTSEQYSNVKDANQFNLSENASQEYKSVIKNAAIALLVQREQSQKELQVKLQRKFSEPQLIEEVVDELTDAGLQSDERFVESFIRAKKSAGKGPILIKHELKDKGISDYLVAAYVYDNDEEWRELAERVYEKKFGDRDYSDAKEKGKRMRFMASRGFPAGIVYELID